MELHAADWFQIDGRPCASFFGIHGLNPRTLQGQTVTVDGVPYLVRSVETFAIIDATGTNFSLMLERSTSSSQIST